MLQGREIVEVGVVYSGGAATISHVYMYFVPCSSRAFNEIAIAD